MVVIKLSRWQEKCSDTVWLQSLMDRVFIARNIQIIEDVPYSEGDSRALRKDYWFRQGIKDVRFKTIEPREVPEKIVGNHKTFREFFLGKHPECDIRILGIAGEEQWMTIARLTQCMADYMDYIAERVLG